MFHITARNIDGKQMVSLLFWTAQHYDILAVSIRGRK